MVWDKDIGSVQQCRFFVSFLIWRIFPENYAILGMSMLVW